MRPWRSARVSQRLATCLRARASRARERGRVTCCWSAQIIPRLEPDYDTATVLRALAGSYRPFAARRVGESGRASKTACFYHLPYYGHNRSHQPGNL
jgi:hypothetical protein